MENQKVQITAERIPLKRGLQTFSETKLKSIETTTNSVSDIKHLKFFLKFSALKTKQSGSETLYSMLHLITGHTFLKFLLVDCKIILTKICFCSKLYFTPCKPIAKGNYLFANTHTLTYFPVSYLKSAFFSQYKKKDYNTFLTLSLFPVLLRKSLEVSAKKERIVPKNTKRENYVQ